ncbi:hypothetical protein C8R46DRAFT_1230265 [Mycena filopes]|nr:hypothetical protein C8R46DRAFT_1230265 [Mycena filopes]
MAGPTPSALMTIALHCTRCTGLATAMTLPHVNIDARSPILGLKGFLSRVTLLDQTAVVLGLVPGARTSWCHQRPNL